MKSLFLFWILKLKVYYIYVTIKIPQQINSKVGHQQRSQSEQTFVSKVTKLESINTTLHSNAIKEIQNDLNSRMSLKPIILPPIIHPNSSKLKQKTSKVPTICKSKDWILCYWNIKD